MIYLDNAATTPFDKSASEIYLKYACNDFFNPSAIYKQGADISTNIKDAKENIANALGVEYALVVD